MTNTWPVLSTLSFNPKPYTPVNETGTQPSLPQPELNNYVIKNSTKTSWCETSKHRVTREGFSTHLSSETLITASSCGIVTAILTVSLHPSSLFTNTALMCFLLEISSSVSFIVAAILLAQPGRVEIIIPIMQQISQYRKWSETELQEQTQWRHNFLRHI